MNENQKRLLIVGASLVGAMLIYPPFYRIRNGSQFSAGYAFIFEPPIGSLVNVQLLLTQWVGVLAVVGLLLYFFRNTSPATKEDTDSKIIKAPLEPLKPVQKATTNWEWVLPSIAGLAILKFFGILGGVVTIGAFYGLKPYLGAVGAALASAVIGLAVGFAYVSYVNSQVN